MLGCLHKCALGLCHPKLRSLFNRTGPRAPFHDKQIETHTDECNHRPALYNRSIFGLAHAYNNLPPRLVDFDTVTGFQSALTREAKDRCEAGRPWHDMYRRCVSFLLTCMSLGAVTASWL